DHNRGWPTLVVDARAGLAPEFWSGLAHVVRSPAPSLPGGGSNHEGSVRGQAGSGRTSRSASYVLALATLLNFVNYIDRFILSAVLPRIKSDLVLNDFQLGMLANAFLVAYFLTSPFFGRLGDRRSRPRLIAAGVALWSLATASAGLARTFVHLLAARAAVGVG